MNNTNVNKVYSAYLKESFVYATHRSGLRILFVPKMLSTYYAVLGVGYGSVDSRFNISGDPEVFSVIDGTAHYLEHKMFEGEGNTDAFSQFSALGANANAFTTNNLTAYLFSCTSNFSENLGVLLDFVRKPYFTEENVEKERGIINEEIEMYEDDPYTALHYGMLGLLYHKHPVKTNVAGTVESVSGITPSHLYDCYNAFYRLDNMILSVCGDTDIDTILDVCDKYLLKDDDLDVVRIAIDEPSDVKNSRGVEHCLVSNPLFCIGIKDMPDTDPLKRAKRTAAASILVDAMFGPSSEFFSRLYSCGAINSMSCGYDSMINYAFSYIIGECKDPELVYREFRNTVMKVSAEGLNRADFARIKKVSIANFIKNFDSTESIATDAVYLHFDGITPDKYADVLLEVDYDFVCSMIDEFFSECRCAMMSVLPKAKDGVK
ncbi:MAG: insulinase family protein [Clostridia bacterium]|nr:insulinase family protein [Clostridia bacterium]